MNKFFKLSLLFTFIVAFGFFYRNRLNKARKIYPIVQIIAIWQTEKNTTKKIIRFLKKGK